MADGYLRTVPSDANVYDGRLYDPTVADIGGFPTQFFGLKAFFQAAIKDLCLVAVADAPAGMGGQFFVRKGGTTYCVYIVETGDANASPIRVRTTTGTKAIRLKT